MSEWFVCRRCQYSRRGRAAESRQHLLHELRPAMSHVQPAARQVLCGAVYECWRPATYSYQSVSCSTLKASFLIGFVCFIRLHHHLEHVLWSVCLCLRHPTLSAKASGCLSTAFVHSSGRILLPRYLMNGLIYLDETYREHSLPLLMTWLDSEGQRWRSQLDVEIAKALTSMLGRWSPSCSWLVNMTLDAWRIHHSEWLWSMLLM